MDGEVGVVRTHIAGEVRAFERFAEIERALEPVETAVVELVVEIDNYIQMQVDIMRGK